MYIKKRYTYVCIKVYQVYIYLCIPYITLACVYTSTFTGHIRYLRACRDSSCVHARVDIVNLKGKKTQRSREMYLNTVPTVVMVGRSPLWFTFVMNQPTNRPITQSINLSTSQPTNQPTIQLTNQLINQPFNQSANKPFSQRTNRSRK